MSKIIPVTDDFAVAPQIALEDLEDAAAKGFKLIINNRPDGEQPGQLPAAEAAAAAAGLGLAYLHLPIVGSPTPEQAHAQGEAIESAGGAVLAHCRSGTRSIVAWAMSRAMAGDSASAIIKRAADAGYDLAGAAGMFRALGAS
jgi:uncharacterized protein (TIGR01244 family)